MLEIIEPSDISKMGLTEATETLKEELKKPGAKQQLTEGYRRNQDILDMGFEEVVNELKKLNENPEGVL